jgi:hypothetical protein
VVPGPVPRAMRLASRLMPPALGRRWLAEAESFLFEAGPEQRAAATRNYVCTAPYMIAAAWGGELAAAARLTASGRAAGHGGAEKR